MADKVTIKIKYVREGMQEIRQIECGDWIDLRCAEDVYMEPGDFKMIPLGVAMELPEGYEALVVPRSSLFKNYGVLLVNSIGIIDESYKGDGDEWMFPALKPYAKGDVGNYFKIPKNERICQFRIVKHQPDIEFQTVDTLGNGSRGGFGSTGRN